MAEANKTIVGYSYAKAKQVVNENNETYMAGYLENMGDTISLLCVLPDWRRKKIGSTLLLDGIGYRRMQRYVKKAEIS